MYFDLNVPVPPPASALVAGRPQSQSQSKKSKGKQPATSPQTVAFSDAQIAKIEARVDLLVRLGYTVIAFSQTAHTKVDPKSHTHVLDPLLRQLRKRQGVIFLKRLTVILDEDSEKGFGLTSANAALFTPYDIIALQPTNASTFSLACLSHTVPSPLTAHIIAPPLTLPRLPFHMKHTLVRTALKNGAVFEINYVGALQGESERRNWWAAAREVARVTKGKGVLASGGVENIAELRAPRDIGNLIALLGLAQNLAHDASTVTPKSLVLRAQTRRTYRAVLSEPVLILPEHASASTSASLEPTTTNGVHEQSVSAASASSIAHAPKPGDSELASNDAISIPSKKRPLESDDDAGRDTATTSQGKNGEPEGAKKRKRKRKEKGTDGL